MTKEEKALVRYAAKIKEYCQNRDYVCEGCIFAYKEKDTGILECKLIIDENQPPRMWYV